MTFCLRVARGCSLRKLLVELRSSNLHEPGAGASPHPRVTSSRLWRGILANSPPRMDFGWNAWKADSLRRDRTRTPQALATRLVTKQNKMQPFLRKRDLVTQGPELSLRLVVQASAAVGDAAPCRRTSMYDCQGVRHKPKPDQIKLEYTHTPLRLGACGAFFNSRQICIVSVYSIR